MTRAIARQLRHEQRAEPALVLHIRVEGSSLDLPMRSLGLQGLVSDDEVRRAVAKHLDIAASRLALYVVERHANGNMTVRPEAVFG